MQKNITQKSTIPERFKYAGKKYKNPQSESAFYTQKNITQHQSVFSCINVQHKIPQYQNAFHVQKYMTKNSTIPERVPNTKNI